MGEAAGSVPHPAGGVLHVAAVDPAQGRQQPHVHQVQQADAGTGREELLEVAAASVKGGPEVQEEGAAAVLQEDLGPPDGGGAIVDGDGGGHNVTFYRDRRRSCCPRGDL